jgi:FkbM family methyltransferase
LFFPIGRKWKFIDTASGSSYHGGMKNNNYVSHFCRLLSRQGLLKENPLQVIDVGARGGPQPHWGVFEEGGINVVGFEPYIEECDRLNREAAEGKFNVPFLCFPVALGNTHGTARLYEYPNQAANSMTPHPRIDKGYREVEVRRFDDFAAQNGIGSVDFMKIDVERHEPEVIQGLGKFLSSGEILGFEIEVHFLPRDNKPLLADIELLLRPHGYSLYDLDISRGASVQLPSPVAEDCRDHNNQPILGPTIEGRMVHGDALFFREIREKPETDDILKTKNVTRIFKMASLFEVYGLPDCAVDLMLEYRGLIEPLLPVDALLNAFVPSYYGEGLTYPQYLEAYRRHVGRVPSSSLAPTVSASPELRSRSWRIFGGKKTKQEGL